MGPKWTLGLRESVLIVEEKLFVQNDAVRLKSQSPDTQGSDFLVSQLQIKLFYL